MKWKISLAVLLYIYTGHVFMSVRLDLSDDLRVTDNIFRWSAQYPSMYGASFVCSILLSSHYILVVIVKGDEIRVVWNIFLLQFILISPSLASDLR